MVSQGRTHSGACIVSWTLSQKSTRGGSQPKQAIKQSPEVTNPHSVLQW